MQSNSGGISLAHMVLKDFLPSKWFSFLPNLVRDQINQKSNFSLEYSPLEVKKEKKKISSCGYCWKIQVVYK